MNSLLKFKNILIVFLFLWYTKCFSYINFPLDAIVYGWISHLFDIAILTYILVNYNQLRKNNLIHFAFPIVIISIIPFLSTFTTSIYNNQSSVEYLIKSSWHFVILSYFLFHILHITRHDLMKIIFILGIIYALIKISQQFAYPHLLFYERDFSDETNEMEIRNGFWRIIIAGSGFFYLAFYYKFEKALKKIRLFDFIIITVGLFAIYLGLGRMGYVSCIISLVIIYFKSGLKSRLLLFIVIFAIIITITFMYSDILFGEMIKNTRNQFDDKDYIRWISYAYYWTRIITNIPIFLFGNGEPVSGDFAVKINSIQKIQGLYISDIGIIGEFFEYGIFYVLGIFYFYFKLIKCSFKSARIYLFAKIVSSFIFYYMYSSFLSSEGLFIWAITAYLIDIEINEKFKRRLIINKKKYVGE